MGKEVEVTQTNNFNYMIYIKKVAVNMLYILKQLKLLVYDNILEC